VEISQENKKALELITTTIFLNFYVICEQNGHCDGLEEGFKRERG